MKKGKKQVSTKEFAEKQLNEIKKINAEIRRKTRRLIITAVGANAVLLVIMFFLIWYLQNR